MDEPADSFRFEDLRALFSCFHAWVWDLTLTSRKP